MHTGVGRTNRSQVYFLFVALIAVSILLSVPVSIVGSVGCRERRDQRSRYRSSRQCCRWSADHDSQYRLYLGSYAGDLERGNIHGSHAGSGRVHDYGEGSRLRS